MDSFAAASRPSRSADGSRFRIARGAGMGDRLVDRAAGRFHVRKDRVARAVQHRVDSHDAIAGQAIGEGADERHRAADRGLISELPPLAFREREQRRSVMRDYWRVDGDD